MESELYAATTAWVLLIGSVICLGMVALIRVGGASLGRQVSLASILLGSLAFLHLGLGSGRVLPVDLSGRIFFVIVLTGALLVGTLLFILTHRQLRRVSQVQLALVQGLRVFVGGGFLMEGVLRVIPGGFSILDGFLHISSGFLALLAAVAVLGEHPLRRALLWLANVVGVADILIIVTGICFGVWDELGPTHNMQYLVFGIGPLLLLLHAVSILKLVSPSWSTQNESWCPQADLAS